MEPRVLPSSGSVSLSPFCPNHRRVKIQTRISLVPLTDTLCSQLRALDRTQHRANFTVRLLLDPNNKHRLFRRGEQKLAPGSASREIPVPNSSQRDQNESTLPTNKTQNQSVIIFSIFGSGVFCWFHCEWSLNWHSSEGFPQTQSDSFKLFEIVQN